MINPLANDLDRVLAQTQGLWDELRGQRIFITGGTGFFGCWLLESFCWANDRLGLNASATVLTRDPTAFRAKVPHVADHPAIRLHVGDVCTFAYPDGPFSHVIHGAAASTDQSNVADALRMFDTMVAGTRQMLEFARHCGARRFLLISSGAVYGRQPPAMASVPEDYLGGPDVVDPHAAYGESKRAAELLCALYALRYGLEPKIARCFAFIGPYLPLDAHFAIGNFIRDALNGGPVYIKGDGTPYRSYLYATDLVVGLWFVLLRGVPCRPYNVGADTPMTMREVAAQVAAAVRPPCPVVMARQPSCDGIPDRYIPRVTRINQELGVQQTVAFADAVARTIRWHALQRESSTRTKVQE